MSRDTDGPIIRSSMYQRSTHIGKLNVSGPLMVALTAGRVPLEHFSC